MARATEGLRGRGRTAIRAPRAAGPPEPARRGSGAPRHGAGAGRVGPMRHLGRPRAAAARGLLGGGRHRQLPVGLPRGGDRGALDGGLAFAPPPWAAGACGGRGRHGSPPPSQRGPGRPAGRHGRLRVRVRQRARHRGRDRGGGRAGRAAGRRRPCGPPARAGPPQEPPAEPRRAPILDRACRSTGAAPWWRCRSRITTWRS